MPGFTETYDYVGPRVVAPPGMHDPNASVDLTGSNVNEHTVGAHVTSGKVIQGFTVIKVNHPLITASSIVHCNFHGEKSITPAAPATRRWAADCFAGYFEIYGSGANAQPIDFVIEKF